jgi:hypothetical protein
VRYGKHSENRVHSFRYLITIIKHYLKKKNCSNCITLHIECFGFLGGYVFFETSLLGATPDTRAAQNAFLDSPVMGTTGAEGKCISFR